MPIFGARFGANFHAKSKFGLGWGELETKGLGYLLGPKFDLTQNLLPRPGWARDQEL